MVLLRHLLGDALRRLRLRQGRTLREVSASARVSLGYLSEVERGQKEASSELLAAICTALDTPLSHVLREVSDNFALAELQSEPAVLTPVGCGPGRASGERSLDEASRRPWALRRPARAPGAGRARPWHGLRAGAPPGRREPRTTRPSTRSTRRVRRHDRHGPGLINRA